MQYKQTEQNHMWLKSLSQTYHKLSFFTWLIPAATVLLAIPGSLTSSSCHIHHGLCAAVLMWRAFFSAFYKLGGLEIQIVITTRWSDFATICVPRLSTQRGRDYHFSERGAPTYMYVTPFHTGTLGVSQSRT
jgi:hypothetical protein